MKEAYEKAKKIGGTAARRALAQGRYPFLTDLDHVLAGRGNRQEVRIGTMEIPMCMVTGTKNQSRGESFACNFMPILDSGSEFAVKWQALYDAQMEEGNREPILVYEYLHRFYVAEGNKRVSVLKYLDQPRIQAQVIRLYPKDCSSEEVKLYMEFLEFFQKAPIYELQFSSPGDYRKLAELLGQKKSDPWDAQLVKDVLSAYYIFEKAYAQKPMRGKSTSDAFLMYLSLYSFRTLLDQSDHFVRKLVEIMAKEFREKPKPKSVLGIVGKRPIMTRLR